MTTPTIHVLATTAVGTEAALKAAVPFAVQYEARVVLLVPHTKSGVLGGSFLDGTAAVEEYEDIVQKVAYPVQIRFRSGREVVCVGCNTGRPFLEDGVNLNA